MNKLFDDQLIECAKNNYNKGRLSALKDEENFILFIKHCKLTLPEIIDERLKDIQKQILEIGNFQKLDSSNHRIKEIENG